MTDMPATFARFMQDCQQRTELALGRWLPAAELSPQTLHHAMRYAVLGGGKRVRPMLVHAAGAALGCAPESLDGPACAIEMIHVYSLIHDDLPAMDDDDLRRGRPTCHKAFDEATAILAGDALQSLAFHILISDQQILANSSHRLQMVDTLAMASGSLGMCGGQAIDLAAEGKRLSLAELENMHALKTGALIRASLQLGALACPRVTDETREILDHYGRCIGLAFQIQDDILDEVGDTEKLGKPQGSDLARNKSTFPALIGLDESRRRASSLLDEAIQALAPLGAGADMLRELARYIVQRDY